MAKVSTSQAYSRHKKPLLKGGGERKKTISGFVNEYKYLTTWLLPFGVKSIRAGAEGLEEHCLRKGFTQSLIARFNDSPAEGCLPLKEITIFLNCKIRGVGGIFNPKYYLFWEGEAPLKKLEKCQKKGTWEKRELPDAGDLR